MQILEHLHHMCGHFRRSHEQKQTSYSPVRALLRPHQAGKRQQTSISSARLIRLHPLCPTGTRTNHLINLERSAKWPDTRCGQSPVCAAAPANIFCIDIICAAYQGRTKGRFGQDFGRFCCQIDVIFAWFTSRSCLVAPQVTKLLYINQWASSKRRHQAIFHNTSLFYRSLAPLPLSFSYPSQLNLRRRSVGRIGDFQRDFTKKN